MSKLNVTTDKRMVISKRLNFHRHRLGRERESDQNLRNVSFSPLSGARRKPKIVKQLIKKHGTRKRERFFDIDIAFIIV